MTHWLDEAARGLATGSHSRREVLRRGGAIAAGSLLGSGLWAPRAPASTGPCTPANCPDGLCCEGRCLQTGGSFGCCHDKIYLRLNKHCCPDAPAGGGHTCLDGEDCCGKTECCKKNEICCGSGQCIPNKSGTIGCCNGATYSKRVDQCCPEHPRGGVHVCAKNETCCGSDRCIPNKSGKIGCCNGATYNKRTDQCCPEQPEDGLHVCAKNETCCGESNCCKQGQVCCGFGPDATCCGRDACQNGVCTSATCDPDLCKPLVTSSGTPWQCCVADPLTCYNPEVACCVNQVLVNMCGGTCCTPSQGACCPGAGGQLVCC